MKLNIFNRKKDKPIKVLSDGTCFYKVKEDMKHKIPAQKILNIQECMNYIALIGVDKHVYFASVEAIKGYCKKAIDENKVSEVLNIQTVCDNLEKGVSKQMYSINDVSVMLLDAFFYLDGEDPFVYDYNTYLKKKSIAEKYPIEMNFFFQNHKDIFNNYGSILNGAIQISALQSALINEVRESMFSNTSKE